MLIDALAFDDFDAAQCLRRAGDTPRRDRALRNAWRVCVLAMIFVAGLLCLSLSYRAVFELIGGAWHGSATLAGVSLLAGVGAKWLCEHRDELVEA